MFTKKLKSQDLILFAAFASLVFLFLLHPAMASEGNGGSLPYEGWLASLRDSVTGPVAFTISLIGLVVAGAVLIFGGDISGFFRSLVFLVLVFALIIGAQNMMSSFFGHGAEIGKHSQIKAQKKINHQKKKHEIKKNTHQKV